ncbi:hypothetical protein L3X38_018151 [Prunus dulcis]|uniref:Protein kinase domain-containing protein n=1 Tax=Prunus dulcis TaxID=3755 RepID=A0AAD4W8P5_PRUDU|nr:hypothetical protein L3X38_018151 [Prunus dulcis]
MDCIIHCDIKPDNILLDAEYNPKLGDFGLAKLIDGNCSRVLTTMEGTLGYLAPEWFSGEAITPKADVFSYGMLLIEVISGRRNRDGFNDGLENYLPIWVANVINEGKDAISLLDYRPTMRQVVQVLERVSDVGISPMPWFLQRLTELPIEAINYEETTSGSDSFSITDVPSAFQPQIRSCSKEM